MKAPKRPYEMVMEIGSDSLEAMAHSLENIVFDIHCMIERGHSNPHVTTSGSPDSGYNFSLVRTDTADHDEYFKQLEIFLDERKKEKEAQQVIQPDAEIIKGVIKGMRVSNKDVKNISALCQKVSGKDHCGGCKYDDDKYDYCPETWYASSLAADLLEARELIKELTNGFEIVRDNTLNPAHSMTVLGLEETTDANHKLALALLEKTKEYAE